MARFFPNELPDTTTSDAERRVFEALRTGLDDSYTVLLAGGVFSVSQAGSTF